MSPWPGDTFIYLCDFLVSENKFAVEWRDVHLHSGEFYWCFINLARKW